MGVEQKEVIQRIQNRAAIRSTLLETMSLLTNQGDTLVQTTQYLANILIISMLGEL
jgi:hypothetical protein